MRQQQEEPGNDDLTGEPEARGDARQPIGQPEYQQDATDLLHLVDDQQDSDEEYQPEGDEAPAEAVPVARPRRNIQPPAWLNDYVAEG